MSAWDVVLTVIISLLVAELGPWCGWLARKPVRLAAALRYGDGDRAAVRAEEWSGNLCEIPGQLSKLAYSLAQLLVGSAVAGRRKITGRGKRTRDGLGSGPREPRDRNGRVWEWRARRARKAAVRGHVVLASAGVALDLGSWRPGR
jgi:hypothetical protein